MVEEKEKEITGYFTDDRNIYCVEYINKNREMPIVRVGKKIIRVRR
jgi:hypothetical protein